MDILSGSRVPIGQAGDRSQYLFGRDSELPTLYTISLNYPLIENLELCECGSLRVSAP